MITQQNVPAHELIGQPVTILDSADPSLKNMHGKIVYETKNLIVINRGHSIVNVPKRIVTISLRLPDGSDCIINGSDLVGRPEDRIQRLS
ncbi:MAG: ribonuclease P protein subunit POP4 [Candidatus Nitrosomirales archaeon]|jgi:ribonuclease P protein subunit POP4